ncbi:MAG: alpha-L-fucosidase [Saprospiraceae bacterium]
MRRLILLLLLAAFGTAVFSQTYQPTWASIDSRPTPEWWLDAKFGIFIHWGVYSVPGYTAKGNYAEWYQHSMENNAHQGKVREFHQRNYDNRSYYDLAGDFRCALFEPDEWAKLFEKAGARYVVLTSKHHDGFCLWPSAHADKTWGFPWNSATTGPRRDLVGDLFAALNKTNVKPGLYYSLYEWYNPLWKLDHNRYAYEHALPQLHDLVTRYQPWVLWSDGDWEETADTWRSQQFLYWLYSQSHVNDRVVSNERWGSGTRFNHAGIYTPEYQPDLDFEEHAWEESRGMGHSYGYNRAEDASDYNSAQTLVIHLLDKVSRGGNFLLDIGPDAYGKIPPIMQERLLEIGKWMDVNGEAIYGTRRWRIPSQWSEGNRNYKHDPAKGDLLVKQTLNPDPGFAVKEVFYTYNQKTNTLYATLPKYPADLRIVLRDVAVPSNTEVTLLATKQRLRSEAVGNTTTIYLPPLDAAALKSPHGFSIKIANFGAYVARPEIKVQYDPQTLQPMASITCPTPDAIIRYTVDGLPPTDKSPAYVQPIPLTEARTVRARAFKTGLMASRVDTAAVQIHPFMPSLSMYRQPQSGLSTELVQSVQYSTKTLQYATVMKRGTAAGFDLDPLCKEDKCGMIWKGYLFVPDTRGYEFYLESDDGSQLDLDGITIVDHDGDHSMMEKTGYA